MEDTAVREEVRAVEELLARVEELPASEAREDAITAITGLLSLYGEALRRITTICSAPVVQALRDDELIAQLLLLHGLDPVSLEARITAALEEVRPYMGSHGGGIELVEVSDGVARVRLEGSCSGCAASTVTLKLAVEEAILRAAPELHAVEAIDGETPPLGRETTGPVLPMFEAGTASPSASRWLGVGPLDQVAGEEPRQLDVDGSSLLFARAGGELYAYLDRCPACRAPFAQPRLHGDALTCGGCGRAYDVRRAGVGIDGGLLQLEPVPLLVEDGRVRVAVEVVAA